MNTKHSVKEKIRIYQVAPLDYVIDWDALTKKLQAKMKAKRLTFRDVER